MTIAQKKEIERQLRNVRNRAGWAKIVLIVFLLVSTAGNVRESWALGVEGWIVAAFAPIALFITNMLFERLSRDGHWFKRTIQYVGIAGAAVISGIVSYVHLHAYVYEIQHNKLFAAILPLAVDIPMILAGMILTECRTERIKIMMAVPAQRSANKIKTAVVPEVPAKRQRRSATRTVPATVPASV